MKPKELKIFCFYCQDHEATRTRIVPILRNNYNIADFEAHICDRCNYLDDKTLSNYFNVKKCILCNKHFISSKSYYDTCDECLDTLRKSHGKL